MDAQEDNLCLLTMPVLVLEKILANIHNPSNVSRTCKYLYEIVCGMEKRRRLMYIAASDGNSTLNVDADAVFDSMMNSQRTIEEIEVRVGRLTDKVALSYELNDRQLERITVIMRQFGANVTSLKLHGFVLPINFILEWLQQATKLESLSLTWGKVTGSVPENATMSLQLPSLKNLGITQILGILDIVDLIPAGSLNSIRYTDESTDVLTTILMKQQKISSLTVEVADVTALCVDHLQLETLIFRSNGSDDSSQLVNLLKCQTNLKELRLLSFDFKLSGSSFQWICNNLKKLEVFEVPWVDSAIERNAFEMLGELKILRHFRTLDENYLFSNGFQSSQFKSDSIEKIEFGYHLAFRCGELLNRFVDSMAHNLPNLTHLQMRFENLSALCFVLRHCAQIIHLKCFIDNDLVPDQLTHQRFPNIQSLQLFHRAMMNQILTSIVRAMPNLKSMSVYRLKFDVKAMKEFIKESKSLEYLCVPLLELNGELSVDDTVETIKCLIDQLKGFFIVFNTSGSLEDFKIKDILSNENYFRDSDGPSFCLCKRGTEKFPGAYF